MSLEPVQDYKQSPADELMKTYQKMTEELDCQEQQRKQIEIVRQINYSNLQVKYEENVNFFKTLTSEKDKRINELEELIHKGGAEENDRFRRETRKYVDSIAEKEAEINNLRRQIAMTKTKANNLEVQVQSISSAKFNYESIIAKNIETVKGMLKEAIENNQEVREQKNVVEFKIRELKQKCDFLEVQLNQKTHKQKQLQNSYNKISGLYKSCKDQCINLKFEVERFKGDCKQPSKPSYQNQEENNRIEELLVEFQKINELKMLLNEREQFVGQIAKYYEMNVALTTKNGQLKETICDLEGQIEGLKRKYINNYEEKLLQERQPSLYEFLLSKKQAILIFEQQVLKLETYIKEKDQEICKVIEIGAKRVKQCTCTNEEKVARLEKQLENRGQTIDKLIQENQQNKQKVYQFEKTSFAYKHELRMLILETEKPKKKGKNQKQKNPRCKQCYFTIEKDSIQCSDCSKSFHQNCERLHDCEGQFDKNETLSSVSSNFSLKQKKK